MFKNENQTLYLNRNVICGCIYRKELLSKEAIYVLFSLIIALNFTSIYYIITYTFSIRTTFAMILLLTLFGISISLIYLLLIQLQILSMIRNESVKNDKLIICDNKERYDHFRNLLKIIEVSEVEEIALLLAQGRVGILKIIIISLLALMSGMISAIFIINGVYVNPLLYVSGIIFVFLIRYIARLILLLTKLRFFKSSS